MQGFSFRQSSVSSARLRLRLIRWVVLCSCLFTATNRTNSWGAEKRVVKLCLEVEVADLRAGQPVAVWLPIPQKTPFQSAELTESDGNFELRRHRERRFDNEMLSGGGLVPPNGVLRFSSTWQVTRFRVPNETRHSEPARSLSRWMYSTPRVPIGGHTRKLIDGETLPADDFETAQYLFERVREHMDYDKSRPGYGMGDAVWACNSRFGNCTDFHSLFLSLARSEEIPGRFEIGVSLPANQSSGSLFGYHCWAWFHTHGSGWQPVDISEADRHPQQAGEFFGQLDANRIVLSRGRNLTLQPAQQAPPLNYFCAPWIELDGKPVSKEAVLFRMQFEDLAMP